jgi:hypothetical protein
LEPCLKIMLVQIDIWSIWQKILQGL